MASNPLVDILGARARTNVYALYAVGGLLIGTLQAAYGALPGSEVPTFVTVGLAVYAYLGTALGLTAASNVKGGRRYGRPGGQSRRTTRPVTSSRATGP